MAQRASLWVADDKTVHQTEIEAVRHEALEKIRLQFPELKSSLGNLRSRFDELANIMGPLALLLTHTTLAPEEPPATGEAGAVSP